jgi:hypothetical protein
MITELDLQETIEHEEDVHSAYSAISALEDISPDAL